MSEESINNAANENVLVTEQRLGRMPRRSSVKALHLSDFIKPKAVIELPTRTTFWTRRKAFPIRSFGNNRFGNCTRAKQAIASMRMERIETRRNPIITDDEIIRVYKEMTTRRYDADWEHDPVSADTGAYETDALSDWRNPETTFKDTKGRPLTIDAYLRINAADHHALKEAVFTAGAHGIAVCLNLPLAFARIQPPQPWTIPPGQMLLREWMPGTWGGHSMWAVDYDEKGITLVHTWDMQDQLLTWEAAAAYLDEAHIVIDKINEWKKKPQAKVLDLSNIIASVNEVSSYPIGK